MTMRIKSTSICVLMGSLIISMSGIRYILNIQESNIIIYGIYMIFIFCSLFLFQKKFRNVKYLKAIPKIGLVFIVYGLVTSLLGSSQDIVNAIKLLIVFFTAISFYLMSIKDIRQVINLAYIFLIIYILFILLRPDRINRYLSVGSNYLVLSLPIGMLLAMMLSRIIYRLYANKDLKKIIIDSAISMMSLMALTKISGRGSILFPFFTSALILVMLGRKHIFKSLLLIILFCLFTLFAYKFFLSHASGYILAHLLTIFGDTSGESRWGIWKNSINYISNNMHWLIGGGIGASVRYLGTYPHNIYLHCIAEFGLIGGIFSLYVTLYTSKIQFDVIKHPFLSDENMLLFTELSAGSIYMLLNFMKSFPVYDSVILLMMVFGVLSLYFQNKNNYVVSIKK